MERGETITILHRNGSFKVVLLKDLKDGSVSSLVEMSMTGEIKVDTSYNLNPGDIVLMTSEPVKEVLFVNLLHQKGLVFDKEKGLIRRPMDDTRNGDIIYVKDQDIESREDGEWVMIFKEEDDFGYVRYHALVNLKDGSIKFNGVTWPFSYRTMCRPALRQESRFVAHVIKKSNCIIDCINKTITVEK